MKQTMPHNIRKAAATSLLIALLTLTLGSGYPLAALADGEKRSRSEAVEIAKQRSGDGRVLSVKKKKNSQGESVYAVKIISKGRVKVYSIPELSN